MEIRGLTSEEVADRKSRGEVNSVEPIVSRSYGDIIIKNVCTMFNLLLFIMGAILLILEEPINAFAATFTIILNIVIATFQEARAKRRLDKIALLMRPKVTVIRDGNETEIDQGEIVKDDIIVLRPGDQALVDGKILDSEYLEMDEALLTGESRSIRKHIDDKILSGSFCVTGMGYYQVDAFGEDSFASKMLKSAKKYTTKKTPLQLETETITKLMMTISFIMIAVMLVFILVKSLPFDEAVKTFVKNTVIILDFVPIALFLLIVINYMVAAIRMSDSGVLLQRANAVESLSHVDTVCMDKTGTITTNRLLYNDMTAYRDDAEDIIRTFASSTGSVNKTVSALREKFGMNDSSASDEIRFSSERKFSAVKTVYNGQTVSIYMGAYTSLKEHLDIDVNEAVETYTLKGLRTVIIAIGPDTEFLIDNRPQIPELNAVAVVAIEDEVRPDCRDTIDVFLKNDMDIKVISGDDPRTVDALFTIANIPGERKIISGEELDKLSGKEKTDAILTSNIFGRMKPDNKEDVIEVLKQNGRYVAMVGDGVNDVKSLKMANVGIALQSGAGAARGVADMVLMNDNFNAIPKSLVEGRRTVSGLRDILKIYLTRNFAFAFIIIFILFIFGSFLAKGATPFLPTQATFYAFISVAIASFLMTLWAEPSENKGAVLPDVIRYVVPMGLFIAIFGFVIYLIYFGMTMNGSLVISYTDEQLATFGWPEYQNVTDMLTGYGVTLVSQIPLERTAEINARNAMLLFMIIANITQMLMIVPIFKLFSVDGKLHKDKKPTILVFVLLALVALAYYAASNYDIVTKFLPITYLNGFSVAFIILCVLVWFVISLVILKSGRTDFLYKYVDRWYSKKLLKIYASNAVEDSDGKNEN